MKLINIGFGNMINCDRVVALVSPDSSPVKRLISDSRETGKLIDCTCGRKTRAVLVTDSDHVILSKMQLETIANRIVADEYDEEDEEDTEGE